MINQIFLHRGNFIPYPIVSILSQYIALQQECIPSKKIASNGSNITPGLIIPILLFLYSCQCPGGCGYLVCQECYDLPMKMPSLHQQYECNVLANAIQNGNFVWGTFFGMMLSITLPSFKVCPRPNAPAKAKCFICFSFYAMYYLIFFTNECPDIPMVTGTFRRVQILKLRSVPFHLLSIFYFSSWLEWIAAKQMCIYCIL